VDVAPGERSGDRAHHGVWRSPGTARPRGAPANPSQKPTRPAALALAERHPNRSLRDALLARERHSRRRKICGRQSIEIFTRAPPQGRAKPQAGTGAAATHHGVTSRRVT
jgi:hypothetical protein